ncbi:MAG: Xaa-Pro peptidase family protein [Actinomycetota bacterium]
MSIDDATLVGQRRRRLHQVMADLGVDALLTADPFSVRYATGTRNMLVHGLTGPDRLALVIADGPSTLWEFAGCEHLTAAAAHVDEHRLAPALSAKKVVDPRADIVRFTGEVADLVCRTAGPGAVLAVDRIESSVVEAFNAHPFRLADGVAVMQTAMMIKQPAEMDAMRHAMAITEVAAADMERAIQPGRSEQAVWAEFHRALIEHGGELVVTRLLQAGPRTFPYFQEASAHLMDEGDLVCFDSDAVGAGGYSVDFSRTFLCGAGPASPKQRHLHELAFEQLQHNAANLEAGRSFESFAAAAFDVPEPYARYGYYQLAHGLGLAGGHPNIPRTGDGPYPLPGRFEPGMVICVESYVGDPDSGQGVKLENQFLIHDNTVETMSTYPFSTALT